jgi:hypothetical protein
MITPIKEQLQALAKDPAKVASEHGRLTGNCCFCNHRIGHGDKDKSASSERSRNAGYGPDCAKKYGLYEDWKRAAAVKRAGSRKVNTGRANK